MQLNNVIKYIKCINTLLNNILNTYRLWNIMQQFSTVEPYGENVI